MTIALKPDLVSRPPGTEPVLIRQARAGDCEAFDELCRLHGNRLLRQATALSGNATIAEDLVQETFIEAWRSLSRYRGHCRYFTWLCSILIHRHSNARRKRWPVAFSFLVGSDRRQTERFLTNVSDAALAPGAETEQAEQAASVLRTLERLPSRQREVVYLRFYAEASLEEIAATLGCAVGTVKSRLFHGLERLRRMKSLVEERQR